MGKYPVPFLCGGTFFALLVESKRSHALQGKKPLNERTLLSELIRIVNPSAADYFVSENKNLTPSQKTEVSKYKACIIECSANIPFNQDDFLEMFTKEVEKGMESSLPNRMEHFVMEFIKRDKMQWLASALLEVIEDDEGIDGQQYVYFKNDLSEVRKSELLSYESGVQLNNLLLGTYYFIVQHRGKVNKKGKDTYDKWFECPDSTPRSPRKFVVGIGGKYQNRIVIPSEIKEACPADSQQPFVENQTVNEQNVNHQAVNHQQVTNQYSIVGGTFQIQNGNNNCSFPGNITNLIINNE